MAPSLLAAPGYAVAIRSKASVPEPVHAPANPIDGIGTANIFLPLMTRRNLLAKLLCCFFIGKASEPS